jgi:predicted lactoylglutathione lyase
MGKTKKARALEATEQFARYYTDRIKELEEKDNIIYVLLCHQYLTFTLTQAQLASTQDSLTAALALNSSQECDHC